MGEIKADMQIDEREKYAAECNLSHFKTSHNTIRHEIATIYPVSVYYDDCFTRHK